MTKKPGRPWYFVNADWKSDATNVSGEPLVGSIGLWTGRTKKAAEAALNETLTSKAQFHAKRRKTMENFRIEKFVK